MITLHKSARHTIIVMALAVIAGACSSKAFLKIQYQLPPASSESHGRKVVLAVTDERQDHAFLTENARKSLEDFNGTFSLIVLREKGRGDLIGAYHLHSFLTEIFKQRLEHASIIVAESQDNENPLLLQIAVQEFRLDLSERKWNIGMVYQASLIRDGNVLARETISGRAERLKVIAKSDAEKIIGELLTDMVNELDIVKLFQKTRQ